MEDIFGNNKIEPISFKNKKEGIVVSTDNFKDDRSIDIFIYELFPNNVPMKSLSKKFELNNKVLYELNNNINNNIPEYINTYNIKSGNRLTKSELITVNYIKCYPKVYFSDDMDNILEEDGSIKEIINERYIPPVGSKVLVEFLNGNPKLPYYEQKYYYEYDITTEKDDFPKDDDIIRDPDLPITTDPNTEKHDKGYYRMIKPKSPYMQGNDIKVIIEKLRFLGYVIPVGNNNIYTKDVQEVIADYQGKNNLKKDKIIGPITYSYLMDSKSK